MENRQDIDYKKLSQEELDDLLLAAVRTKNTKDVKVLHQNFANPLVRNGEAFTIAANNNDINTLAYLLRHCDEIPSHVQKQLVTVFVNNDSFDHIDRLAKTLSVEKLEIESYLFSDLARKGHLSALKYFHEHGYDLRESDDWTLIQAAEGGSLETVKFMVEDVGADIKARDYGALASACSSGHLDVVEYLHKKGSKLTREKNYPLWIAAYNGHIHVLDYLKENGINIHKKCGSSHPEYPISIAAGRGRNEAIKYLLENGADIHAGDDQALYSALWEKDQDTIELLLEHGANIHALDTDWQEKNKPVPHAFAKAFNKIAFWRDDHSSTHQHGPTMLSRAAYRADIKNVKDFINRGANVTANNYRVVRDLCKGMRRNKGHNRSHSDAHAYNNITKTLVAHLPEILYEAEQYQFSLAFFETHDTEDMRNLLPPETTPAEAVNTLLQYTSYAECHDFMHLLISEYNLDVSTLSETSVISSLICKKDTKTLGLLLDKGLDENIIKKQSPKLLFDIQYDPVAEQQEKQRNQKARFRQMAKSKNNS